MDTSKLPWTLETLKENNEKGEKYPHLLSLEEANEIASSGFELKE